MGSRRYATPAPDVATRTNRSGGAAVHAPCKSGKPEVVPHPAFTSRQAARAEGSAHAARKLIPSLSAGPSDLDASRSSFISFRPTSVDRLAPFPGVPAWFMPYGVRDGAKEGVGPMPFKSKAQRRKFAELLVKGEITPETYEEWNRETGSVTLPERVRPKAQRKTKGRPRPSGAPAPPSAVGGRRRGRDEHKTREAPEARD